MSRSSNKKYRMQKDSGYPTSPNFDTSLEGNTFIHNKRQRSADQKHQGPSIYTTPTSATNRTKSIRTGEIKKKLREEGISYEDGKPRSYYMKKLEDYYEQEEQDYSTPPTNRRNRTKKIGTGDLKKKLRENGISYEDGKSRSYYANKMEDHYEQEEKEAQRRMRDEMTRSELMRRREARRRMEMDKERRQQQQAIQMEIRQEKEREALHRFEEEEEEKERQHQARRELARTEETPWSPQVFSRICTVVVILVGVYFLFKAAFPLIAGNYAKPFCDTYSFGNINGTPTSCQPCPTNGICKGGVLGCGIGFEPKWNKCEISTRYLKTKAAIRTTAEKVLGRAAAKKDCGEGGSGSMTKMELMKAIRGQIKIPLIPESQLKLALQDVLHDLKARAPIDTVVVTDDNVYSSTNAAAYRPFSCMLKNPFKNLGSLFSQTAWSLWSPFSSTLETCWHGVRLGFRLSDACWQGFFSEEPTDGMVSSTCALAGRTVEQNPMKASLVGLLVGLVGVVWFMRKAKSRKMRQLSDRIVTYVRDRNCYVPVIRIKNQFGDDSTCQDVLNSLRSRHILTFSERIINGTQRECVALT